MLPVGILTEFKERMHLGDFEDDNLERILRSSYIALVKECGDYTFEDEDFKELVFERSRYVYNDALEYFDQNFLTRINTLAMEKAVEEMREQDETEQVQP